MATTTDSSEGWRAPKGGDSEGSRAATRGAGNLCLFRVGERVFALDVAVVSEVVPITGFVTVPLAPRAVRGLYNLRGLPVAVVDAKELLGLGHGTGEPTHGLLVRAPGLVALLTIDGVVAVQPADRGERRPVSGGDDLVEALYEPRTPPGLVAGVLRTQAVLERLQALRFPGRSARDPRPAAAQDP